MEKLEPGFYVAFRVIVGFLFFSHGASKLFGWFGGNANPLFSMFGLIGVVEVLVGLFVLIGLFSRPAAIIGAIDMLVAYLWMHLPNGIHPFQNGGELALLFLAAFLVVATKGAGRCSAEMYCEKRKK